MLDPAPLLPDARRAAPAMLRDECGASLIEFALVLPVFLSIVLGILAFGIYFGAAHSVEQLAADAARASFAGKDTAERQTIATQHVAATAANYPLLLAASVTVEATPVGADVFKVAVRYNSADLPIWFLSEFVPLPPQVIERISVVKYGRE